MLVFRNWVGKDLVESKEVARKPVKMNKSHPRTVSLSRSCFVATDNPGSSQKNAYIIKFASISRD